MKRNFLFLIIIPILILVACSKDERFADLKAYVDKLKQESLHNKKPSLPSKSYQPAPSTYQKDTARTPFDKTAAATPQTGAASNPVNRHPLTLLKFLGTVSQGDKVSAYISTPDGKIYQVTIGDKIGDHDGTIVAIGQKQLQISEPASDDEKIGTQRIVTLQLKDESN